MAGLHTFNVQFDEAFVILDERQQQFGCGEPQCIVVAQVKGVQRWVLLCHVAQGLNTFWLQIGVGEVDAGADRRQYSQVQTETMNFFAELRRQEMLMATATVTFNPSAFPNVPISPNSSVPLAALKRPAKVG